MEEKIKEKVLAYRLAELRLNSLLNDRNILLSDLSEIESTLKSLDEFERAEEIFFPLASGTYALGKILDKKKVIVSIGANVALEKNLEEAKEFLNKRKEEIEKILEKMNEEIARLSLTLKVLEKEIEKGSRNV